MIARFLRRRETDRRIALALEEMTLLPMSTLSVLDIERDVIANRLDDLCGQRRLKLERIAELEGEISLLGSDIFDLSLAIAAQEAAERVLCDGGQVVAAE